MKKKKHSRKKSSKYILDPNIRNLFTDLNNTVGNVHQNSVNSTKNNNGNEEEHHSQVQEPTAKPNNSTDYFSEMARYRMAQGPITRSKEYQNIHQSSKKSCENYELSLLKKFDDYYKDRRNLDNEMFVYKPPRIDKEKCQVDFQHALNNTNIPMLNKKYLTEEISKEDLAYYLKFVGYYQNDVGNGNMFLCGVHSFETRALELLKACKYDIRAALVKILFPVMDQMDCLSSKDSNQMIYMNSALNDLIGSNIQEKEEWIKYITERINNKIDLSDLQPIIEMGIKMKIDIPHFVQKEISNSLYLSKCIKQQLSNKNNSLNELCDSYEISRTYNVQTEEFANLGEIIKKTEIWMKKVNEIKNMRVTYKTLQSLYNEGKSLPIKFEGEQYHNMKTRFESAQEWHQILSKVPKHSKTRQQGFQNQNERCTLGSLAEMIKTAEKVNFTSHEVDSLKKNYELLCQAEKKIETMLNDDYIPKTKELFKDFINTLDNLRFATNLYDIVESKLALIEWNENKDIYLNSTKALKMKHLKHLVKLSDQKSLINLTEIIKYKEMYNQIDSWLDKMTPIFYSHQQQDSMDSEEENEDNNNKMDSHLKKERSDLNDSSLNNNNHKINQKELIDLYNQGKAFKYIPEEVDELLLKCDEVFEFISECKKAIESTQIENQDYSKLFSLKKSISQYNIQCEEFDFIDNQSNTVQQWIVESQLFIQKYEALTSNSYQLKSDITSLENRQYNIEQIEDFINHNEIYYERIINLLERIPPFAKSTSEAQILVQIREEAARIMEINLNDNDYSLQDITRYIYEMQKCCVSKQFYSNLLQLYKKKSWLYVTSVIKKMTLGNAEKLLKEAMVLLLNGSEVDLFKEQIARTKEWIKQEKKILNLDKISYSTLIDIINDGSHLPFYTEEIEKLNSYKEAIDTELLEVKVLLLSKPYYIDIEETLGKINKKIVDTEEFDVLIKLKNVSEDWIQIANKMLSSRELCQLYFKSPEGSDNKYSNTYNNTNSNTNDNGNNNMMGDNELNQSNQMIKNDIQNVNETSVPSSSFLGKKRKNDQPLNSNNNNGNSSYYNSSNISSFVGVQKKSKEIGGENLLSLVNTIPSQKILKLNSSEKKFQNSSYEERYKIISQLYKLKDSIGEQYCICRKGDDSVNSMVMCDSCKEWFHLICLKIPQATADAISHYYCLACCRRKDTFNNDYHNDFFTQKRISYDRLVGFVNEGKEINATFTQMDKLIELKDSMEKWNTAYAKCVFDVISFYNYGNPYLNETFEKNLSNLYLESEGFCAEVNSWYNSILIIRQSDWFKEAKRCLEGKKSSEKHIKKLLSNAYGLFNNEFIQVYCDIEQKYFELIIPKGIKFVLELNQRYQWNNTQNNASLNSNNNSLSQINNIINTRFDNGIKIKENNSEDILSIQPITTDRMINNTNHCLGNNTYANMNSLFIEWKQCLHETLLNPDATADDIKTLFNKAKSFNYSNDLINKVLLLENEDIDLSQADKYYSFLFESESEDVNMN